MVKCKDCGILGHQRETGEVVEAPRDSEFVGKELANPICYVDVRDFSSELEDNRSNYLSLIEREYSCEQPVKYRPGKTPKEHEEMSLLEKVELRHNKTTAVAREALYVSILALIASIVIPILIVLLTFFLTKADQDSTDARKQSKVVDSLKMDGSFVAHVRVVDSQLATATPGGKRYAHHKTGFLPKLPPKPRAWGNPLKICCGSAPR